MKNKNIPKNGQKPKFKVTTRDFTEWMPGCLQPEEYAGDIVPEQKGLPHLQRFLEQIWYFARKITDVQEV